MCKLLQQDDFCGDRVGMGIKCAGTVGDRYEPWNSKKNLFLAYNRDGCVYGWSMAFNKHGKIFPAMICKFQGQVTSVAVCIWPCTLRVWIIVCKTYYRKYCLYIAAELTMNCWINTGQMPLVMPDSVIADTSGWRMTSWWSRHRGTLCTFFRVRCVSRSWLRLTRASTSVWRRTAMDWRCRMWRSSSVPCSTRTVAVQW